MFHQDGFKEYQKSWVLQGGWITAPQWAMVVCLAMLGSTQIQETGHSPQWLSPGPQIFLCFLTCLISPSDFGVHTEDTRMKISTCPFSSLFSQPCAQLFLTSHYYPNLLHLDMDSEIVFSHWRKTMTMTTTTTIPTFTKTWYLI